MRVGRNPLTAAQTNPRENVVVGVITHMPNDWQQYHHNRLPIVALSLRSLRKHAGMDFHLAIWDNGSHIGFRNWIANEIQPDTFVMSQNVGKSVARKSLFGMFPEDCIMAISDDDMFYFPNWLKAQVELLYYFDAGTPQVGTVTGYPVKTSYRWANDSAKRFGETYGELISGDFILPEWDADFCTSIGRDYGHHLKTSTNIVEYKIRYNGREALAVGHHCQFVCFNGRIAPLLRWDADAMADEKPFDKAVDDKYMRLCTPERYSQHMGNVLDDKLLLWAKQYNLSVSAGNDATSQHNRVTVRGGRNVAAVKA